MMNRRDCLILTSAAIAGGFIRTAAAETYPANTINIIVPFPPAGSADLIGRLVQQGLAAGLGGTVIVTNHPGGGGNNGAALASKAKPDGYTLLVTTGALSQSPYLFKDVAYNPIKSFDGISLIAETYTCLAVRADSPFKSLQDIIDAAKPKPGELIYASAMSSSQHVAGELFSQAAGIKLTHAAYQGGLPNVQAVVKGEATMAFVSLPNVTPLVANGTMRIIAVAERRRIKALPDVPAISETFPDVFVPPAWVSAFAPKGTPRPIIDRLSRVIQTALDTPEKQHLIEVAGFTPVLSNAAELDERLKSDVDIWGRVIPKAGIKQQ